MDTRELNEFGKRYAQAWGAKDPQTVAEFYAVDGALSVNDDAPAVGRDAIAGVVRGFMTAFPDIAVSMDDLIAQTGGAVFHWTLTGTNSGPGGTGQRVRISGQETWQVAADGLIGNSKGRFDRVEYERQLKHGVDG